MCDHPNREAAMTMLSDTVWCDPCLVPLVKALNDGGVTTVASCCGHGRRLGTVTLSDGRWLVLVPDEETLNRLAVSPVAIAGAEWPEQLRQRDAEVAAKTLEDAADGWTQGGWAQTKVPADRASAVIGTAQAAGDWLRQRAARIREEATS